MTKTLEDAINKAFDAARDKTRRQVGSEPSELLVAVNLLQVQIGVLAAQLYDTEEAAIGFWETVLNVLQASESEA